MPITEILARNAKEWPNAVALVEINPQELESRKTTWREYSLMIRSLGPIAGSQNSSSGLACMSSGDRLRTTSRSIRLARTTSRLPSYAARSSFTYS